jgi:hypothetical protein
MMDDEEDRQFCHEMPSMEKPVAVQSENPARMINA